MVRVRYQKLGEDFLLCAFIDANGVVSSHHHHVIYPAKIKNKIEKLDICNRELSSGMKWVIHLMQTS